MRKSGRSVREDWPRYHEYARTRGSIYGGVTGIKRGDFSEDDGEDWDGERYARGGEEFSEKYDKEAAQGRFDDNMHGGAVGGLAAERDEQRYAMRTPSPNPDTHPHQRGSSVYPLSPTLKALYPHDDQHSPSAAPAGKRSSTPLQAAQPYIQRDTAISRTDLLASAERIYSRYLMPGADKEVYLPPTLRIHEFPLSSSTLPAVSHPDYDREADAQARVPDMFHAQKEYVYRAMEMDTFPRFLRAKAFGNLTPISALVRLGVGLLALWVALATAFAFIFLDYNPKIKRLWVSLESERGFRRAMRLTSAPPTQIILPFTVAIINLVAHSYDLDPLLVFMGLSETVSRWCSLYPCRTPLFRCQGDRTYQFQSTDAPLSLEPLLDPLPHHRHSRALCSQAALRPRPLGHLPHRRHCCCLDRDFHRHPRPPSVDHSQLRRRLSSTRYEGVLLPPSSFDTPVDIPPHYTLSFSFFFRFTRAAPSSFI